MGNKVEPKYIYTPAEIDEFKEFVEENFGPVGAVMKEIESPDIVCDILVIYPDEKRNYYTLVTCGAGAYEMDVPSDDYDNCVEYSIRIPADYDLSSGSEKDYWPVKLLKDVARFPVWQETWLGYGHDIQFLDEGKGFASNNKFNSVVLTDPDTPLGGMSDFFLESGRCGVVLTICPVYNEEMEMLEAQDDAFSKLEVLLKETDPMYPVVNINRMNVVTKEYPVMPDSASTETDDFVGDKPTEVYSYIRKSYELLNGGNYDSAKSMAKKAVSMIPTGDFDIDFRACTVLARVCLDRGELAESEKALPMEMVQRISECDDSDVFLDYFDYMGDLFMIYDPNDACEAYEQGLDLVESLLKDNPDYEYADEYITRGVKFAAKGMWAAYKLQDYDKMTDLAERGTDLAYDGMGESDNPDEKFAYSMLLFNTGVLNAVDDEDEYKESSQKAEVAAQEILCSIINDGCITPEYGREYIRQMQERVMCITRLDGPYEVTKPFLDMCDNMVKQLSPLNSMYEEWEQAELDMLRGILSQDKNIKKRAFSAFKALSKRYPHVDIFSDRVKKIKRIL